MKRLPSVNKPQRNRQPYAKEIKLQHNLHRFNVKNFFGGPRVSTPGAGRHCRWREEPWWVIHTRPSLPCCLGWLGLPTSTPPLVRLNLFGPCGHFYLIAMAGCQIKPWIWRACAQNYPIMFLKMYSVIFLPPSSFGRMFYFSTNCSTWSRNIAHIYFWTLAFLNTIFWN